MGCFKPNFDLVFRYTLGTKGDPVELGRVRATPKPGVWFTGVTLYPLATLFFNNEKTWVRVVVEPNPSTVVDQGVFEYFDLSVVSGDEPIVDLKNKIDDLLRRNFAAFTNRWDGQSLTPDSGQQAFLNQSFPGSLQYFQKGRANSQSWAVQLKGLSKDMYKSFSILKILAKNSLKYGADPETCYQTLDYISPHRLWAMDEKVFVHQPSVFLQNFDYLNLATNYPDGEGALKSIDNLSAQVLLSPFPASGPIEPCGVSPQRIRSTYDGLLQKLRVIREVEMLN
jgi:hypothetical protein